MTLKTISSYDLFINGEWLPSGSGETFTRESPVNGATVARYARGTVADVDLAVTAAKRAMESGGWSCTTSAERQRLLSTVAGEIRAQKEELAQIETMESGKPITQARDEMEWAANIWDYASALCRTLRGDTYNALGEGTMGLSLREPIGVVALITPWNFPLLIISQKLPFALAAGCSCVIKPSELTSGTTLKLAGILQAAGLPAGTVNVVTGFGDPVGAALAAHADVEMISFTGSTVVGKHIVAASAGNLKKVSLELGGKNPQVLFPDADLSSAVEAAAFGVAFNMGECCNSGSRILVHESIADEFVGRVVSRLRDLKTGNPLDPASKLGAIINRQQFEKILGYIKAAQNDGAKVALKGAITDGDPGWYIEPTVFDHVTPSMSVACEEIFGPVLSVLRFKSEAEAVALANGTCYGLSASVWTTDFDRALRLSRAIRAGTVWINCFMDGIHELSFGGYRQSGLGRELGIASVEEFTEVKSIVARIGPQGPHWWMPSVSSDG